MGQISFAMDAHWTLLIFAARSLPSWTGYCNGALFIHARLSILLGLFPGDCF